MTGFPTITYSTKANAINRYGSNTLFALFSERNSIPKSLDRQFRQHAESGAHIDQQISCPQ